jgi:hypothetical protein
MNKTLDTDHTNIKIGNPMSKCEISGSHGGENEV